MRKTLNLTPPIAFAIAINKAVSYTAENVYIDTSPTINCGNRVLNETNKTGN